jgi:hypothetical protein
VDEKILLEWLDLINILGDDVQIAFDEYEKDQANERKRRAVYHFMFAFVEGTIFMCKRVILEVHKAGYGKFSRAQFAMLNEESYDLDRKGNAIPQKKFLKLEQNIKFSFKAYASLWSADFVLDIGTNPRWDALLQAIAIRNRITHPRNAEDTKLSDKDMVDVSDALAWFAEQVGKLFDSCSASRKTNPAVKPSILAAIAGRLT